MKIGLLLPGQGAQLVGMGADFAAQSPAARHLFDQADEILDLPLSQLCFAGPIEELTRTDIAQPAIYLCSMAALAALGEQIGEIKMVAAAGLSLGEYTALAATGAFSFADGLRLVRLRGLAMQEASVARPSGMTSVMGMQAAALGDLCAEVQKQTGAICQIANLNSPGQIVVSGEIAALDVFDLRAKEAGARRAIRLQVAGAFHSEVMRPAANKLEIALNSVEFRQPCCPVWQNASAAPSTDPAELKTQLAAQLTAPVRWQESFQGMAESVGDTPWVELAPGRVLAGLARKIAPSAKVHNLHQADALAALASELAPA
jgi:[acyl-carrier-protein] S-malonyltransferase